MNTNTATETSTIHPFQTAGLGLAPFRYVGQVKQDIAYGQAVVNSEGFRSGAEPMITTKAGGTCAYCGNGILNMFNVKSADGKIFHVGSDCIAKVGGPELARKVAKVVSANRTAQRHALEAEKIAAAVASLARPETQRVLGSQGHPSRRDATMLDYVTWSLNNAGTAGKLRAAKLIAEAIG